MLFTSAMASIQRRAFLGAGLGLAGALSGAGSAPASAASPPLDFSTARDNVYGFVKSYTSLSQTPVFGAFEGVQYAIVGKERARPLFRFVGFGNMQGRINPDGSADVRGKEVAYFLDLKTGEVLDTWDNPWTGERVKVLPFYNDQSNGHLSLEMPTYAMGAKKETTLMNEADARKAATGGTPFILPWRRIGDQYLFEWDYAHEYANPVTPEGWPKASTGPRINPSEHFVFYVPAAALDDRAVLNPPLYAGFARQGPWWPWMLMGKSGVDGVLMGRMHTHRIKGTIDEIHPAVLKRVLRDRPDMLEPMTSWTPAPVKDTWSYYAAHVPPETPGYGIKPA